MTLHDAVTAALPGFRAEAEGLMIDACVIRRPTGALAPGTYEPDAPQVYAGPCKVQTYEAHEQTADVGGGTVTTQRYSLHIPVGAYQPAIGDVIAILRCQHDANLASRRFVVRALLHKAYATAYRLGIDDITTYGQG